MKQPGLRTGIRIDAKGGVVFPGDVQAPGYSHEVCRAVRTALLTRRFIFGGIPGICHTAPFSIQGQCGIETFLRSNHPGLPVFGDDRHPITGQIEWGRLTRRARCAAASATAALSVEARRQGEKKKHERAEKSNRQLHRISHPM